MVRGCFGWCRRWCRRCGSGCMNGGAVGMPGQRRPPGHCWRGGLRKSMPFLQVLSFHITLRSGRRWRVLYTSMKSRSRIRLRDLLQFASYELSPGEFSENWTRYVLKLATGAGKTKILSLLIAWSYFNRIYEEGSGLSKNFLLITPNIIVLDRLKSDFKGCDIFFTDPVVPENGYRDREWHSDFQVDVHIQDDVQVNRAKGNLFLTNVHRVYMGETIGSDRG